MDQYSALSEILSSKLYLSEEPSDLFSKYSFTDEAVISPTLAFLNTILDHGLWEATNDTISQPMLRIGDGATSTVYRTKINPPEECRIPAQTVAVKKKRRRGFCEDADVPLAVWMTVCYADIRVTSHRTFSSHQNILHAIGYMWEEMERDGPNRMSPCLLMETTEKVLDLSRYYGTLKKTNQTIGVAGKYRICEGIAEGIASLHEGGVVHGDIKPQNILMFLTDDIDKPIPKIADFSHSIFLRDFKWGDSTPRYRGTKPFYAPELIEFEQGETAERIVFPHQNPEMLKSCDIFYLGRVLFQIFSDGIDFVDVERSGDHAEFSLSVLASANGSEKTRMLRALTHQSTSIPEPAWHIIISCLNVRPHDRYSAWQLLEATKLAASDLPFTLDNRQKDWKEPYTSVYKLRGITTEFLYGIAAFVRPQISIIIQRQIIHELMNAMVTYNRQYDWKSAFLLSVLGASGFGYPMSNEEVLQFLHVSAEAGNWTSVCLFDRVERSMRVMDTEPIPFPSSGKASIKLVEGTVFGAAPHIAAGLSGRDCLDMSQSIQLSRRVQAIKLTGQTSYGRDVYSAEDMPKLLLKAYIEPSAFQPERPIIHDESIRSAFDMEKHEIIHALEVLEATYTIQRGLYTTLYLGAANWTGSSSSEISQKEVHLVLETVWKHQGDTGLNIADFYGRSPVVLACQNGHLLALRFLLEHGAISKSADVFGCNPLHWLSHFAESEMEDAAGLLVASGVDLNQQSTGEVSMPVNCLAFPPGCTPLHFAVGMRNITAVRILLGLEADYTITSKRHFAKAGYLLTPLHFAISLHFYEIARLLIELPQTGSRVKYLPHRSATDPEEIWKTISILNLVTVPLMAGSVTGPFSKWIWHGPEYEDAVSKTIDLVLDKFPELSELDPLEHIYTSYAFPPDDPYITQSLMKRVKLEPMQICHLVCNTCHFNRANSAGPDLLLCKLTTPPDKEFLIGFVGTCAVRNHANALVVLLNREWNQREAFRDVVVEVLRISLVAVAQHNCLEVLQVMIRYVVDTKVVSLSHFLKGNTPLIITPLQIAVLYNSTNVTELLLDHGAEMDSGTDFIGTPLDIAARSSERRETALLLLRRGATTSCRESVGEGYTVLHAAVRSLDIQACYPEYLLRSCRHAFGPDIVRFLNSKCEPLGWNVLFEAIAFINLETVELYIELTRGNFNTKDHDKFGVNPLLLAAVRVRLPKLTPPYRGLDLDTLDAAIADVYRARAAQIFDILQRIASGTE